MLINLNRNEALSYVAGFFDGEGWFCISHGSRRGTPTVGAGQKSVQILIDIASFMKTLGVNFIHRDCSFGWSIEVVKRNDVRALCTLLLPYLQVKKRQAELILEFLLLRDDDSLRGRKNIDREREIVIKVKTLNGGRFL